MSDDSLADRRKELEESFFRKQNQALVDKLKAEKKKVLDKEGIRRVSGIADDAVLERLVALHMNAETRAALTLFPLIEVAWADGAVADKEKKVVVEVASQTGIQLGSDAMAVLEGWLAVPPAPAVHDAWVKYVQALVKTLSAVDRAVLKKEVLGRARAVAEAAGGMMGMGNKVSRLEAAALKKLEAPFDA